MQMYIYREVGMCAYSVCIEEVGAPIYRYGHAFIQAYIYVVYDICTHTIPMCIGRGY